MDALVRRRTLRRYRFMFKVTLAELAMGVVITLIGLLVAVNTSNTQWIGFGLLMTALALFGTWKILNSTVRLLEVEARDMGWDNLV